MDISNCWAFWADKYPDIYKTYTRFQLEELNNPLNISYTPLPLIIQKGPQCGLVALAMCLKTLNINLKQQNIVDELYETAKTHNYTYNGEMFSAVDMLNLAKEYLPDRNVEIYSGTINTNEIKEFIMNGGLMLVP